jgi:AcrR family transcriptional regulator
VPRIPSRRKQKDRYHHGDLRRALVEEAVATIAREGVERLTLRGIGERLGVSRTALYRHFADKSDLLAAVATEGFRLLRRKLEEAWDRGRGTLAAFDAMGVAYVRFALEHPFHYRVMFGANLERSDDPNLHSEAAGAFQALVNALLALQQNGLVRRDPPLALAGFVWATVHGIAMLAIDGRLGKKRVEAEELARFANERLRTGIAISL